MTLKEKILEAALRVFLTKGYTPASMNDIAEAAKTSKGGIYHHFKNKEELFHHVMIMLYDKMSIYIDEKMKNLTSIFDVLKYFFSSSQEIIDYLNQLAGNSDIAEYNYHILMLEAIKHIPDSTKDIDTIHNRYIETLVQMYRDSQDKGEIRKDLDPEVLAIEAHALFEGLFLVNVTDKSGNPTNRGERIFKEYWKKISTSKEIS